MPSEMPWLVAPKNKNAGMFGLERMMGNLGIMVESTGHTENAQQMADAVKPPTKLPETPAYAAFLLIIESR